MGSSARTSFGAAASVRAIAIDDVDYSAAIKLRSTYDMLRDKGIRMAFVLVSDDVKAEFDRFGITGLVGEEAFYSSGDSLLSDYQNRKETPD